jgi:TrmH family RNA methyltransferase
VTLTARELAGVADTVSPQPVMAIVESPEAELSTALDAVVARGVGLVGVDVRDPGNVGTILRSAESAGAGAVIWCDGCADATGPKAVRSSAGALFHVATVIDAGPAPEVIHLLRDRGIRVIGTSVNPAATPLDDLDLSGPVVFVLANEASGLEPATRDLVDELVTIPTAGRTESLNVAMAATVLVFETARRRRSSPPAMG